MSHAPSHARTRHSIEVIDGSEWIVVPAARHWIGVTLIAVGLVAWTVGGILAVETSVLDPNSARFGMWVGIWAIGWVVSVLTLAWQFAGKTLVGVQDGALVYRWKIGLISKMRRHDCSRIRDLRAVKALRVIALMQYPYPPFLGLRSGSVVFKYGRQTVRLFPEVDEAEGRMLADWLAERLPDTVTG